MGPESSDLAVIDRFLASRQLELGLTQRESLDDLVARWRRFVVEVEGGYELTIYDYTAELALRDSLSELHRLLSAGSARDGLSAMLDPLDERLRFATRPSTRGLAPGVDDSDRFWWFRVPRLLKDPLQSDLEADGLL